MLLHSYVIYPFSLKLFLWLRNFNTQVKELDEFELPFVSTITAVFNEESVIQQKVISILESDYPKNKLNVYLGSDCSTDRSDFLMLQLAKENSNIHFARFDQRRGKASVVNDLVENSFQVHAQNENHILIFTDANVILDTKAIRNMVRHFIDSNIGLVDSRIIPFNQVVTGIAPAEIRYINLETLVKNWEGKLWGVMMGAFGGCFAVRSTLVSKIPTYLITDDFYLSMMVLEQGASCINDTEAICYEGIPSQMKEEFKRKLRISSGNFQSLAVFKHFLYTAPISRAYAFISHKVFRWLGPLFLLLMYLTSGCLAIGFGNYYIPVFITVNILFFAIPAIDWILSRIGIHVMILRGIRYFISMNLALLLGLFRYLKGIKHSVWEPPKRNHIT
ncbi:MAG: glycosyltransferase [Saprospiraceae bacterium]|nr:glycosyltransferase [Saprospiraceae bacterium]